MNIADMHTLMAKPGLRVLNFSHQDLDGGAAAIVVQNSFEHCDFQPINYGRLEDDAIEYAISHKDDYDVVVFTDYCPHKPLVDAFTDNRITFLVLDHHKTSEAVETDCGVFVLDTAECGAMMAYRFFQFKAFLWQDVAHMKHLAQVANDHDMWIHKDPMSVQLNRLYYALGGENEFIVHFAKGLPAMFDDADIAILQGIESEIDAYYNSLTLVDLSDNGCYVECSKHFSDISIKLDTKYSWYVMVDTVTDDTVNKLSFRCRVNIDVGAILKSFGMGGGGHPSAAGQKLPKEYDWKQFIMDVHEKMFS